MKLVPWLLLVLPVSLAPSTLVAESGYAPVNGLRLYYEWHGSPSAPGVPLVLLHGGGSTIPSTYGQILPEFSRHRRVLALELQAHGHTRDIDRPLSFEQDADDVYATLQFLHVAQADIMGFSNGGTTALQIAIRHPGVVHALVLASAVYRRDGLIPGFFDGFRGATLEKSMPLPLKQAFLDADPDPKGLQAMYDRDVARMKAFRDIPEDQIAGIAAPTLVINADRDVVLPAHALLLSQTLAHGRLAILPGVHGEYLGEICSRDPANPAPALVAEMIGRFLSHPN